MSNDIDWTPDKVNVLVDLWYGAGKHYLTTEAIATECRCRFEEPVSKSAIVGKAHRLHLVARGSPIKQGGPKTRANRLLVSQSLASTRSSLPPLPSLSVCMLARPPPPVVLHAVARLAAFPSPATAVPYSPPMTRAAPSQSDGPVRVRHRDGCGCQFPIGTPGTAEFRYCDDDLVSLSKPYCADHAKRCYQKPHAEGKENAQWAENQVDV